METSIRWEGESAWEGLDELHVVEGVEIRITEMPDTTQVNNELATTGALVLSIGFVFVKLTQQAVIAVRDILVKRLEARRGKIKVKFGKAECTYEGPLTEEQRHQLLNDLKRIAAELTP